MRALFFYIPGTGGGGVMGGGVGVLGVGVLGGDGGGGAGGRPGFFLGKGQSPRRFSSSAAMSSSACSGTMSLTSFSLGSFV